MANGQADWTFDSPPNNRLNEIATKYPGQLHLSGLPWVHYMALNTHAAPFDNVKVRQAVNCDRSRSGDQALRWTRTRTADLPDPADRLPGVEAVLPVHEGSVGERPWSVDRAGRRQGEVTDRGIGHQGGWPSRSSREPTRSRSSIEGYFVSLLNQLGYKAQLKRLAGNVLKPVRGEFQEQGADGADLLARGLSGAVELPDDPGRMLDGYRANSSHEHELERVLRQEHRCARCPGVEAPADRPDGRERALDEGRSARRPIRPNGCRCSSPSTPRSCRSGSGNYEFASTAWLMLDRVWVRVGALPRGSAQTAREPRRKGFVVVASIAEPFDDPKVSEGGPADPQPVPPGARGSAGHLAPRWRAAPSWG